MQSCLGIYVQNKLIKYAKISKERNIVKVEAYGVKFIDSSLDKIIEQIVQETFSFQVPISVNIDKEKYTYANVFALLKPQDLEKAMDTEFEMFCNSNQKNKNTLEYRKIKSINLEDRDKTRVIYTYADKTSIVEKLQLLDGYKVKNISPISTTIQNINETITQDDCAIVNIEEETTITTIVNGQIYMIDKIEEGMGKVIDIIAARENSVQRAYDICKNTTVYTRSSQNLKIDGNEYLDEIINLLFSIIDKVKEVITNNGVDIKNIYLSGMGIIINNIDLLFQENFIDKKCEILMPSFIEKTNVKINIKDYIEVNSAIALAIQGIENKNQENNFTNKKNLFENTKGLFKKEHKTAKAVSRKNENKTSVKDILNSELTLSETMLSRGIAGCALIIMLYIGATEIVANGLNAKTAETEKVIATTNEKIAEVSKYNSLINNRTSEYQSMIDKIDEENARISESYSSKNAVPNLLNKIMYNVPTGVQILSIENPHGKNVIITAQASKYDQLGYFKAVLEEEGILNNITTTKGVKPGETINITITGELPY